MSLASDISPHLPFLRRFSRALTGHQQSGDAYVAALLEAVVADPNAFDTKPDVRTALYRAFCGLWESVALNLKPMEHQPSWEASATEHMAAMPPNAREAFLLMAVEGFTAAEIANILKREPADVSQLVEQASQSIVTRVATDVLVIEDEPIIAMDIEALLDSLGHKVIGVARTETEALRIAAKKKPGLVLADIQLADGSSGIDAVNKMLRNFQVPVIFITAFPERLLTGERPEPAFLITKPFVPDMVKAVVSQALFFDTKSQIAA
jgi:CheY-like chemotaxis protein/DNA-directed RNA polymerase specialized sigma24 family protein